tara:strand:- start:18 stop:512 length:495 start_codon:yes stop_codon:yes gene_type:complete
MELIKMAWEMLSSTTLTGTDDTIDSGAIDEKKSLMFQCFTLGANTELQFQFNSDSGSDYSSLRDNDGSASGFTNQTMTKVNATGGASYTQQYCQGFLYNLEDNAKILTTYVAAKEATGAGTIPRRAISLSKYIELSNYITSIQAKNNSTGDFAADSYLYVYGTD